MIYHAKVLHRTPIKGLKQTRIETREVTRRTVKASYVSYEYYICRPYEVARISRHAAVMLGVKV